MLSKPVVNILSNNNATDKKITINSLKINFNDTFSLLKLFRMLT